MSGGAGAPSCDTGDMNPVSEIFDPSAWREVAGFAFEDITGSEWKPFVPQATDAPTLQRRAGTEEMGAFG